MDNEHPKYDYDKLIAESTGLYRDWWILWKRIHPEWALIPDVFANDDPARFATVHSAH